jgi:hypothetical protein
MFDRNEFVGHLSMIRASSVSINTSASIVAGILASLDWDAVATGNFVRVANGIYTMYYAAARISPECSCQRSLFTDWMTADKSIGVIGSNAGQTPLRQPAGGNAQVE